jgi:hypothetical protein
MKYSKNVVLVAALAIISTLLSGCVLVPIAGFGYSGYQYHEKEGVFAPGQPLGGPAPDDKNDDKSTASSSKPAPPPSENNIE